jgi:hypothetical protein
MRGLLLGTILLLLSCVSLTWGSPGPILWDSSGVAIRQGYEIEWQRSGDVDAQGNLVYVWSDTRQGDRDVYAQRVNSNGQKTWAPNGLEIVHYLDRQEDPSVVATGFGSYIFIWNDFRVDINKGDMYAQRVDAAGNLKWGAEGRLITTGDFDSPAEFRLVADGAGGAIMVWNDLRENNADIYATRVDSSGTILWSTGQPEGVPVRVRAGAQNQISTDTDGQGGALVAWTDELDSLGTGKDVFIQHINANGTLAWSPNGVAVCDTIGDQDSPKICKDGSGGVFVVWQDKREDAVDGDLFFQHLNSNGQVTTGSTMGLSLARLSNKQQEPRLVNSETGVAIIIWMDSRNDPGNYFFDVYAQKVNAAGQKLWSEQNGIPVCVDISNQSAARLYPDGLGNVVCAWMDQRDGNENQTDNIYAQKINSNGSMAWATNGVIVCDAVGQQADPLIRAQAASSMIGWSDWRSGSLGLWYQKLDANGNRQLGTLGDTLVWGISGNSKEAIIVRNNNNKMFVFFQDEREGTVGQTVFVQVVDTSGQVLLQPNGVKICPNPTFNTSRAQKYPDACSDGGSGMYVIWLDQRDSNPENRIYAQRVSQTGARLWSDGGVSVSPPGQYVTDLARSARIISDGSDGAIVLWSAQPSVSESSNIYATKLSSSGNLVWEIIPVTNVPSQDEGVSDVVPDGSGGVYISYIGGNWWDLNVYGQHLNSTGTALWGSGVLLCDDITNQVNCRVVGLGTSGAVFVWEDNRAGDADIYAQKVNSVGQIAWGTTGIPLCVADQDQKYPALSKDFGNNVFAVWEDSRIDSITNSDVNIYMQEVTPNGQILLPINGEAVTMAQSQQAKPAILSDNQGGNFIFWEDSRGSTAAGPNIDVFGSHLDAQGNLSQNSLWITDGNWINIDIRNQNLIQVTDDFAGGVLLAWDDQRSSGKATVENVYAQRVNDNVDAVIFGETLTPREFRLFSPYPNPFNPAVRLRFSLNHPGNVQLSVWDVAGRQVAMLKDGWQREGLTEITWEGGEHASGIYFVRLQFEGKHQQQKVLLLK